MIIPLNVILGLILWNLLVSTISHKLKLKNTRLYCGQLAFSSNKKFDPNKIKTLMYINAIERGMDATGVWSPLNDLDKSLVNGCGYSVSPWFKPKPDTILMAHMRAATVGDKKNVKNTHPFLRGNYILQHNGTLINHPDLFEKYELKKGDFHVDSDVIAGCIEKCDNIAEVLEQINGPAAIIIHDLRIKDRLYAFRNKERPLYYGKSPEGMYISSIEESLLLIQCKDVTEFKENTLYTIENDYIIDMIKIKNKPYSKPYKYFNTTPLNLKLAINCRLRGLNNIVFHADGKQYNLVKGAYYIINQVVDIVKFEAVNVETSEVVVLHHGNFNHEDIIKSDDYVMCLADIYATANPKHQYMSKDVVYKCKNTFSDGELSIFNEDHTTFLCTLSKEYVRKLTPAEVLLYTDSKNETQPSLPVPFKINDAEKSAKVFQQQLFLNSLDLNSADDPSHDIGDAIDIITSNDNSLDDPMVPEVESEDMEEVNTKELDKHFNRMDYFLKAVERLTEYEETPLPIRNKIKTLVNVNEKAKHRFIKTLKID